MTKCLVLSLSDRPDLAQEFYPTLIDYCLRHEYDISLRSSIIDKSRHIAWSKILWILYNMTLHKNLYDLYIWIDDDILITNKSQKIHEIIQGYDFNCLLISEDVTDWCPLNSGIIIAKYSDTTIKILQTIYDLGNISNSKYTPNWEQDAIVQYYRYHMHNEKDITLVPHNLLQSFYRDYDLTDQQKWKPGHFSAHLTGMSDLKRKFFLQKILYEISQ